MPMPVIPADKATHIIICAILFTIQTPFLGPYWAGVSTAAIGAAKEVVWDKWMAKGTPDINDFWADLLGIALASAPYYAGVRYGF